jgi:autotransporter passenger strand-loop-strand repeat protein
MASAKLDPEMVAHLEWLGFVRPTGLVLSGGTLDILSGGTTVGTTVNSGGSEIVSSGGTASNTIVSSGGSLVVSSGGLADPATIYNGGSETISKGGTDLGAHISGGLQIISGLVSRATIFAGLQGVQSGGTAIGTSSTSRTGTDIRCRRTRRRWSCP